MKETINIVFACDSNYAQHATVAMMSILKNTADPARIVFYLLDDQINAAVKEKIQATIEQAHAAIHFCEVEADRFEKFFVSGQLIAKARAGKQGLFGSLAGYFGANPTPPRADSAPITAPMMAGMKPATRLPAPLTTP